MATEVCSSDDAKRATLPDGELPVTIRLSFTVHSVEEEDRFVSLLAFAGVRAIASEVVSVGGVEVASTNGDAPQAAAKRPGRC